MVHRCLLSESGEKSATARRGRPPAGRFRPQGTPGRGQVFFRSSMDIASTQGIIVESLD